MRLIYGCNRLEAANNMAVVDVLKGAFDVLSIPYDLNFTVLVMGLVSKSY